MANLGIYDSGIGGLTVLKKIIEKFGGIEIVYLADNKNHPFGNKEKGELEKIIADGINGLKEKCDAVALACNTASLTANDESVFKLLPPISFDDALLMATDCTLSHYGEKIKKARTGELASLIEVEVKKSAHSHSLDVHNLKGYLEERLSPFVGVGTVILGCSHYPFCKPVINEILGRVNFVDGGDKLCDDLRKTIQERRGEKAKISFEFTGRDESETYFEILDLMMTDNAFSYI